MPRSNAEHQVSAELLAAFDDAWNRHDVDAIMAFFAEDCIFIAGWGERFEGVERVRQGVEEFFARFPDARFSDARHFVCGDRGVSEWRFSATASDGKQLDMIGCDLFTFKDGKIAVKDAFRKDRRG